MKNVFLFLAGITVPVLSGYIIVSIIEKKERVFSGFEKFILSYAIGTGMLVVYMLLLSLLGYSYSWPYFIPYSLLFFLSSFALLKKGYPVFSGKPAKENQFSPILLWQKVMVAAIFTLLSFKLVFVLANIIHVPTYFDDAFTHWNYRAKIIYFEKTLNTDLKSESFLGGTHKKHYPLYVQLLKSYVMIVLGSWDEFAAKLISFLFAFFLLAIIYLNLKDLGTRFIALFCVYLSASVPLFLIHSSSNYADLTISFFFTASGIYLCKWFESRNDSFLVISACMLGIANLTKNEGLILYAPSIIFTFLVFLFSQKKDRLKVAQKGAMFLSVLLAFSACWFYMKWEFGLGFDESGKNISMEFHPEAFRLLYEKLLFEGGYNLFWIFFLFALVGGWNVLKKKPLRYNFILTGTVFGISLLPFIFSHNFEYLYNEMTIHRTMLIPIPFAIYNCGLLLNQLFANKQCHP